MDLDVQYPLVPIPVLEHVQVVTVLDRVQISVLGDVQITTVL